MTDFDKPPEGWSVEADLLLDRTWSDAAYWLVLVAAAAVDVVNFQTVIAIVMRDSGTFLTWTVVAGFTVLALALSHQVGVLVAGRVETGHSAFSSGLGWLAFIGWLAMGLFAFAVRYRGPAGSSAMDALAGAGSSARRARLFLVG
jgi:hypothetical protein